MLQVITMTSEQKEIHEMFESSEGHTCAIQLHGEDIGYVAFREESPAEIYVEYLLAVIPGKGEGRCMVHALFELGYEKIEGDAIYGSHFFWERIGTTFIDEVDPDGSEGVCFTLTADNFYKKESA